MKESRIKHLELIHNVIDRLSHKSFLIKSWSITAITALMAFGIDKEDYRIFIIGFPVSIVFWFLDSQYLWLEKVFRKLFEGVRKKEVEPMSMDISVHKKQVNRLKIFFRPTIWPIYLFEIILLVLYILYFRLN